VLSVIISVTEPAVGYGGGAALLYFHKRKKKYKSYVPNNVSGLIGLATENKTWAAGAFHSHTFGENRVRTTTAVFKLNIRYKYYGNGSALLAKKPIGVNFEYQEEKFDGILLRDSDSIHSKSIIRTYNFTPYIRSAVPLTENERLSFFTEVGLLLGVSNGLTRNTKNVDEIEKIYNDNFNLRLGISPGITFFAMENFAFEVQLDVLGYELQVKNKEINGIEQSQEVRHNVDFNIDILSLKLGLAYYFGRTKQRKQ